MNAIVLIDRIGIEQDELKRSPQDAVIGAALQRFRPILLATFTTVLGLIPLYIGGGDVWRPMAVTIMVGLLFGTVITLLFIPSIYSVFYKINFKDGVKKMLTDIQDWKDAPLWTPKSIRGATKTWFKYMTKK